MDHVSYLRVTKSHDVVSQCLLFMLLFGLMLHNVLLFSDNNSTKHCCLNNTNIDTNTAPMDICERCPGVEYFMNQNLPNLAVLQANISTLVCTSFDARNLMTDQAVVYGVCKDWNSKSFCLLHVEVLQDMVVRAHVERLAYGCESSSWRMNIIDDVSVSDWILACHVHSLEEYYIESFSNHMYIWYAGIPEIRINFEAIKHHIFLTVYTAAHSGYVLLPVQSFFSTDPRDIWGEVTAPPGYIIMISFQRTFQAVCGNPVGRLSTELIYNESDSNRQNVVYVSEKRRAPASVLSTSSFQIHVRNVQTIDFSDTNTLKMIFSFHTATNRPPELLSSLFNCSVDYYSSFRHHLECNLKSECEDGQDETEHCPFSNPGCQGLVASYNKCFHYVKLNNVLPFRQAMYECQKIGGKLASIKTKKELEDVKHIFQNLSDFCLIIGYCSGGTSMPFMYSAFLKWSDNTLIYNINHLEQDTYNLGRSAISNVLTKTMVLLEHSPLKLIESNEILCETKSLSENLTSVQTVQFPVVQSTISGLTATQQTLLLYQDRQVIHTFLSCEAGTSCEKYTYLPFSMFQKMTIKNNTSNLLRKSSATGVTLFKCDDDISTLSYTLVCDFRQDCPDNSDESFCLYPLCNGFLCISGQCVFNSQHCNQISDCLDNSDEKECSMGKTFPERAEKKQPLFINLDGTGYFTQQLMTDEESCPDTHYRCTDNWMSCLPVYTRCNGFFDCTYGEDEQDCENVTCPGFYHCHLTSVCVHGDHLCDGWGQCPQRDDEWLCDTGCPEVCLCQGHSFTCPQPFPADLFPMLRYMDATGSGMTLSDFTVNTYLIHLSLTDCSLLSVPSVNLPNLQFIDITHNQVKTVNMNVVSKLWNLRVLILKSNPLTSLTSEPFSAHFALKYIDLSNTLFENFNIDFSVYFPEIKHVNLSFSSIKKIGHIGFRNIPQLTELDVRGNSVNDFPSDLLSKSNNLKRVFSSNFRFCCEKVFTKQLDDVKCSTPRPVFSLCKSLLSSELQMVFFWVVSVGATLGNLACLSTVCNEKIFAGDFIKSLAQLQIASFFKGIQISIVTVTNEILYGNYTYFEKAWTSSVTCKLAGFLSLMSSEVTVLIIWFMTVDHVIKLCFPSTTTQKFNRHLTVAACAVTWFFAIVLSVVPFLPGLSHWGLDGQSGLCRLALFDHNSSQDFRWFTVTVTFNVVVCLMIVIGQVIIYRQTPVYPTIADPTKRLVYSSGPLMAKLAGTEVLCWLSLGLTSAMSSSGVSEGTYVAIVVYMIPLTATLSPVLYIWYVTSLPWQQAQEERLLKVLKIQLAQNSRKTLNEGHVKQP